MNKIVAITGANSGIGLTAAQDLARQGFDILALCRNKQKGEEAVKIIQAENPAIKCELWVMDLSNLQQVSTVAEQILAKYPTIDVLLNNAGYYPASITYTGEIEDTLYASHVAHQLLTLKLLPALEASGEGRVINVSSMAHMGGKVARFFQNTKKPSHTQAYCDAKLANILFTVGLKKYLASRKSEVTTYSLHPGPVKTNFENNVSGVFRFLITIFKPFIFIDAVQGAVASIYLSSAPINDIKPFDGQYFIKKRAVKTQNRDITPENVDWQWKKTMEILQSKGFTL